VHFNGGGGDEASVMFGTEGAERMYVCRDAGVCVDVVGSPIR